MLEDGEEARRLCDSSNLQQASRLEELDGAT